MGVPVVASRIGGLPETVVDGETGLLVEPNSPEALAEAVCELLLDDDRRRRMGSAARRWVIERHNWRDSLDRMMGVYARVMNPGMAGSRCGNTGAAGRGAYSAIPS
jgi:phosphatidylinositol alpha-1,6-mannosyltransferase